MSTFTRVAIILAVLSVPSLAAAADWGGYTAGQCGGGFVPAAVPAPAADPGRCDAVDHPAGPHVHIDGRWIGHDSGSDDPRFVLTGTDKPARFAGGTGPGHLHLLHGQRERFETAKASFSVAAFEYRFTDSWYWEAESIAIYEDPVHTGWYLAYSPRLGNFVHVQYLGPAGAGKGATKGAAKAPAKKESFLSRFLGFWTGAAATVGTGR